MGSLLFPPFLSSLLFFLWPSSFVSFHLWLKICPSLSLLLSCTKLRGRVVGCFDDGAEYLNGITFSLSSLFNHSFFYIKFSKSLIFLFYCFYVLVLPCIHSNSSRDSKHFVSQTTHLITYLYMYNAITVTNEN